MLPLNNVSLLTAKYGRPICDLGHNLEGCSTLRKKEVCTNRWWWWPLWLWLPPLRPSRSLCLWQSCQTQTLLVGCTQKSTCTWNLYKLWYSITQGLTCTITQGLTCTHTCMRAYLHMHTNTCACAHTNTHTHIHTHMCIGESFSFHTTENYAHWKISSFCHPLWPWNKVKVIKTSINRQSSTNLITMQRLKDLT